MLDAPAHWHNLVGILGLPLLLLAGWGWVRNRRRERRRDGPPGRRQTS